VRFFTIFDFTRGVTLVIVGGLLFSDHQQKADLEEFFFSVVRMMKVLRRTLCLTHVDKANKPTMIDVSNKISTFRTAHARCFIELPNDLVSRLNIAESHSPLVSKKGPVFVTAIIAGVMAAKKTSELIPFCHPLPLEDCKITIDFDERNDIQIDCVVSTTGKTGVEMEALVGATNAALCVYDMCKAMSHDIKITRVELISKTGGKRTFHRDGLGSTPPAD
jgi:cyclic pyranopterin monophosphate synthase